MGGTLAKIRHTLKLIKIKSHKALHVAMLFPIATLNRKTVGAERKEQAEGRLCGLVVAKDVALEVQSHEARNEKSATN